MRFANEADVLDLCRRAQDRATGADIHGVNGTTSSYYSARMYQEDEKVHPDLRTRFKQTSDAQEKILRAYFGGIPFKEAYNKFYTEFPPKATREQQKEWWG